MHPIILFLKGFAMGAANVIPGVSGGTIAFITGIYETLIESLKSFDHHALGHLLKFRFAQFAEHVNLKFLVSLMLGVVVSILTLAKVLLWLFETHPTLTWAFFFGLIIASVIFVGKSVKHWSPGAIASLVIGTAIAVAVAFATPAQENENFLYLVLCGAVAFSSMIIPGLSGSFVLVLLGNYLLVLNGIDTFRAAFSPFDSAALGAVFLKIILPVGIGIAVGFLAFSHLLSYLFKNFYDATIALITGFILGSLLIIWPWKKVLQIEAESGKLVTTGYEWFAPPLQSGHTYAAFGLILAGFLLVWLLEKLGADKPTDEDPPHAGPPAPMSPIES